jgi:hypothetical protein
LTALVSLVIFISFLNHIFAVLATLLKMKNKFSFLTSGYRDVTNFGTAYNPGTTFAAQNFNFSSINALDGASSALFRITLNGATATAGNNRFDNIQLNATENATAVPFDFDPSLGLLALGGAWGIRKMIKKSKSNIEK